MPRPRARLGLFGAAAAASGLICLGSTGAAHAAQPATAPAPAPRSAFDPAYDGGANVPGLVGEYLATGPNARTNGSVIGPDYTQGTLASEAVGREAVQLTAAGQYVQFTVGAAANAVDVDYALPQGASGTLSVYVDGHKLSQALQLTSAYSYISTPQIYGSLTHHFFNDVRLRFGFELHRGDTVRLQADAADTALPYTVNLADFYQVAQPLRQPAHTVSVVGEGADPSGATDSTAAFAAAISAADAAHEAVWIPAGNFAVDSALQIQRATIEGAGDWYSQVHSNEFIDNTAAVPGPVNLKNFAILGSTVGRHDDSTANAINGSLGTGAVVDGLWIQNTNVGFWLQYGNTGVTVQNSEVFDTDADGLNLNGNATGVVVRNDFVRNTGDDGLAIWSYPAVDSHDTFAWDTVEQPNLANGIAEYGGSDNTIAHNVIADSNALGSGLTISNEQFAGPGFTTLAGTIDVDHDTVIRSGAMNPNWGHPMSAIQIDAYDYAISDVALDLSNLNVFDTPYSVFELVSGDGTGLPISGLRITNANIRNVGTVVFQGETQGSAYVAGVHATGVGVAGTVQDQYPPATPQFQFQLGPGNTGWGLTPTLAYFPNPSPAVP
ncbi:MAG TPA: glycosyl hydrolase family 28-related protein [Actinospica sp.]|nr:glycosyl hydrolase family 28-related protein [Actinospica sp.]